MTLTSLPGFDHITFPGYFSGLFSEIYRKGPSFSGPEHLKVVVIIGSQCGMGNLSGEKTLNKEIWFLFLFNFYSSPYEREGHHV